VLTRNPTDHELMLEVRNGSVEKLGRLFERHHKYLYNFFLRSLGDRVTSEDLVQEVFLRILNYRHTYRPDGEFLPWLFAIARNARIDHYRNQDKIVVYSEAVSKHATDASDPESDASHQGDVAILQQALAQLTPEKREALILSRFQDLRYQDIGKILGCSVNAVKVRVFRALQDLRENFYALTGETHHGL